ncbi:galactose-binding domain-like protein [Tirmania nivea]|nr:galactose-binding domain-like protein [Tirmania nivea]
MAVKRVDPVKFKAEYGSKCTDLASAALGGTIHSCSDQFFADASNLLTPTPPVHKPGVYVPTGIWYDGWETRRHNHEPRDWVIIKLGVPSGRFSAFEVDTAFFNGNQAPAVTVEGATVPPSEELNEDGSKVSWDLLLPMQECGPSQRHIWVLDQPTEKSYTHLRLSQYPDGGIARFRAYGNVVPIFPEDLDAIVDLAHVSSGALVTSYSDEHYGHASNLLLPGRGKDMSDGWETKRSREPGHVDWVIVRLGAPGTVEEVVVDTAYYLGNFPREVRVEAVDWRGKGGDPGHGASVGWRELVLGAKCRAHHEHAFPSTKLMGIGSGQVYSHIKMTIVPDGGVKRLRVFGKRAADLEMGG